MNDELYIQTLQRYWGYDSFRGVQLDIIRSIAQGHDTLGLMPTGGGKSVTFQVPALCMEGVCIVVTPLIALMKDQVDHLKARGMQAEAIYSGKTHKEVQRILDNAVYGAVKFLYVSPERLANKLFLAKLHYMKVCFFAVDEAHCISQWGYDFRPSYLKVSDIRQYKPEAPVLALTATATPAVVDDIQDKLLFGKVCGAEKHVYSMSFKRDNLSYVVRRTGDKNQELLHILNSVKGCAIVYTRDRKNTKEVANWLCAQGLTATYYHAGLDFAIKDARQRLWQDDEVRVMVATNAFGMGIDKADVRLVIHMDSPDSLEAYFQEAGRAGRDGKRSYAVLLCDANDRKALLRRSDIEFPPREYIRKVYDHLAYFFELAVNSGEGARYIFNADLFCTTFRHYPQRMEAALTMLQRAGYISYDLEPETKPRVKMMVTREDLYYIHDMSQVQNDVLNVMLRMYGSLFVDYTYVDDYMLANMAGVDVQRVHVTFKELAHKGVLKYVPRQNMPLLTYLRDRVDGERLMIGRNIYEDLRERMLERLNAVIGYLESTTECRQEMLLHYFGEQTSEPCGHCDYCVEQRKAGGGSDAGASQGSGSSKAADLREHIVKTLSAGGEHVAHEFLTPNVPEALLHSVMGQLVDEGLVGQKDGCLIWLGEA